MSFATTDDGVKLYFEETGSGTPVIFVHEYAGDQCTDSNDAYSCSGRSTAWNSRSPPAPEGDL